MPNTSEKRICCTCGESLLTSKFYKSYSSFYFDSLLPICKDCFAHKFGEYAKTYKSNKMAMQRMCMMFDIYFDEEVFDKCDTDDETVVGKYFRNMNRNQLKNKTFDNCIADGNFTLSGDRKRVKGAQVAYVDEYGNVQDENPNERIDPKDVERWGIGFEAIDYKTMTNHYKMLKKANPNCDDTQEFFMGNLCQIYMQQSKALREKDTKTYKEMSELYMKTHKESGLKTVRDTSEAKEFLTGVSIATIEKYTPAEFYKDQKLYKDFDGIGGIIKRFFTRPLKNLQFGTNEQDEEYSIQDGDEDE